jgi:tRNA pseudouridine32 synthase/23S rRNA pseudouridine746 synthase
MTVPAAMPGVPTRCDGGIGSKWSGILAIVSGFAPFRWLDAHGCVAMPGGMSGFVYMPPDTPLRLIHRDSQIVVVHKPAGLLSVPGRGDDLADCLIGRLRRAFPEVLLVHRLDLDTSGVMVFALTRAAQANLGQQFEMRQVRKVYLARVRGRLEPKEGRVDLPLAVDWPNRPRQQVNHETGRAAVTDWRVVRAEQDESRVRLMPQTGRSHQLRVHMAEIGHPILGDPLYATGAARDFPRLMLHAESLRLRDIESGRSVTFSAPCPF